VRRMFEAVGHAVSRLIRIRYGAMVLPRGLKRGHWMELGERDIAQLMQAAGMSSRPVVPSGPGARGGAGQPGGSRQRRADRAAQGPRGAYEGTPKDKRQNTRTGGQQPDPMKTSLGYIGTEGFRRNGPGGRPVGAGGGRRGSGPGGPGGPAGGSRRGGRGR
jgi:23S rRNA pseudouridine2605 synthase